MWTLTACGSLAQSISSKLDVHANKLLTERLIQREHLSQHAESLKSKLWALEYHQGNFRRLLADASLNPNDALYETMKEPRQPPSMPRTLQQRTRCLTNWLAQPAS